MTAPTPSSTDILVIAGSSRNDGNTWALIDPLLATLDCASVIDLNALTIAPYDYGERIDDDFLSVAKAMVNAKAIVFASPVYWYAMSAQMKVFFDRLTDLTGMQKALGKALAGKPVFLIATGQSKAPPSSFEPPFADTAQYFHMRWGGMLYAQAGAIEKAAIAPFAARIAQSAFESLPDSFRQSSAAPR